MLPNDVGVPPAAPTYSSKPSGDDHAASQVAINYFAEQSFEDPDQAERLLGEPLNATAATVANGLESSGVRSSNVGGRLGSQSRLNTTEEMHYFRQYNYYKYCAAALQAEVRGCRGCVAMLADLERLIANSLRIRNRLVEANLRLVISIVNKIAGVTSTKRDELISVGSEALLSAVEKFDYRRGFRFSSYAYAAIQRSIYGALRADRRHQQRLAPNGHEITDSASKDASSADRQYIEAAEARREVHRLLQVLEPREREILMMRLGFGANALPVSFQAIGQSIGLSKQRVATLYHQIMAKLRRAIANADGPVRLRVGE